MGRTMKRIKVTGKRKQSGLPIKRDRSGRLRRSALERDGYTCQKCNEPYPESNLQADHTIPLSQGGPDEIQNIQTLCLSCHADKTLGERVDDYNTEGN